MLISKPFSVALLIEYTYRSTSHQTLRSVLSYARISDFKLNKPPPEGRRESLWILLNKNEHTQEDNYFHDPFACTNLATLCGEVVEVGH